MEQKKGLRFKIIYNELLFNHLESNKMKEKMNLNPQNGFFEGIEEIKRRIRFFYTQSNPGFYCQKD